ncbi:ParB/RepB/Spo0J family partition protein [Janibacter anophelis]|uniref:ParB/RepB/Spo0J family partition protein n=1 Tax=Janibacter anophelis TaxID=319054 RepID=UPI000DEF0C69|nr:ParB/RepB/Spo0J family partition protein [Janibacter anophelis]
MKTKVSIDRALEHRVLSLLCIPKSVGAVAQETALSLRTVEDIAARHGHPNLDALRAALAAMDFEDQIASASAPSSSGTGAGGRELRTVPVTSLHPDPDNPRDDLGDIAELADSIREGGLLQPIVARQRAGQLIIVAGHRRLAAVQHLGWDSVDVVVTRDMRPDEVLAAMIIENGQRRDLDPIEEARAFARLKKLRGLTSVELGERIGRGQAFVDSRLRLLELPAEDQDKVRAGQMGVTYGTQKARVLAGKVRSGGGRIPHLGADHSLAGKARARCAREHDLKRALVGKTACGDCWESVIRADERQALTHAAIGATCATCGHHDTQEVPA